MRHSPAVLNQTRKVIWDHQYKGMGQRNTGKQNMKCVLSLSFYLVLSDSAFMNQHYWTLTFTWMIKRGERRSDKSVLSITMKCNSGSIWKSAHSVHWWWLWTEHSSYLSVHPPSLFLAISLSNTHSSMWRTVLWNGWCGAIPRIPWELQQRQDLPLFGCCAKGLRWAYRARDPTAVSQRGASPFKSLDILTVLLL